MLWTLLIAISSLCLPWAAIEQVHRGDRGLAAYLLGGGGGVVLALCNAWLWSRFGARVERRASRHSAAGQERYFRALYVAAFMWVLPAAAIGMWFGRWVARML